MNGDRQDNGGVIIIVIALFVAGILFLYFLSKTLFAIGIAITFVSLVLFFSGMGMEEETLIKIGIIGFVIGVILAIFGYAGINFFENNPTGKNLLESANTIVNTTKEGIQTYQNTFNIIK